MSTTVATEKLTTGLYNVYTGCSGVSVVPVEPRPWGARADGSSVGIIHAELRYTYRGQARVVPFGPGQMVTLTNFGPEFGGRVQYVLHTKRFGFPPAR